MSLDPGRVQEVFLAALERGPPGRAAVLDRECAADPELRQRVEALLVAHDHPDSRLDRPFVGPGEPHDAIRMDPADRPGLVPGEGPHRDLPVDHAPAPHGGPVADLAAGRIDPHRPSAACERLIVTDEIR